MQVMNLQDLLAMGSTAEEAPPALPEATVRQLLSDALTLFDRLLVFSRGDMIRITPGLYNGTHPLTGGVAMFMRYHQIEPDDWNRFEAMPHGAPIGITDVDCIIALVTPSGAVGEYYACSRYFEHASLEVAPEQAIDRTAEQARDWAAVPMAAKH